MRFPLLHIIWASIVLPLDDTTHSGLLLRKRFFTRSSRDTACTRGQARKVFLRAGSGIRVATVSTVSTASWIEAKAASRLFCPACDRASRWAACQVSVGE